MREVDMNRQDRIERQMVVPHAPDHVWESLTTRTALSSWFGDVAEIDLRPGGSATFGWTDYGNVFSAVVEVVDPPRQFAFRWAARPNVAFNESPTTLVTFTLTEVPGGTNVQVVESGLASLPDEVYDRTLQENTSGWKAEFADLEAYLAGRTEETA